VSLSHSDDDLYLSEGMQKGNDDDDDDDDDDA